MNLTLRPQREHRITRQGCSGFGYGPGRLHAPRARPRACGHPDAESSADRNGRNAARLRLQFLSYGGRADWLLGGTPGEAPDRYAQVSAFTYVDAECPPTLLMHGTHDEMAPVSAVRQLQRRLVEAGVPVTAMYLPHTDHMFDLVGMRWSPAARVAVHVLEQFLATLSTTEKRVPPYACA